MPFATYPTVHLKLCSCNGNSQQQNLT